jgi:outer membrane protein
MVRLQEAGNGKLVVALAAFIALVSCVGGGQAKDGMPVYDLSQCIDIALEGSRTLAIAGENTKISRQGLRQSYAAFLPDFSVSRTYQKSDRTDFDSPTYTVAPVTILTDNLDDSITTMQQIATGEFSDQKTESTYQDYGASTNWNIFRGFGKFAGLSAAKHDLKAAEYDATYARQQVVENVVVAYIKLGSDEALLEVAVAAEDLARRELEKSETYYRIGSAAKSDVLQAKVRLGQTRLDVIRARNTIEQSFANLAYAMNRPLIDRFDVDRSLMSVDFEVEPLEALFETALTSRTDMLSLVEQAAARGKDVASSASNLWPSLDVFARYTRYKNESPFRFGAQESDNLSYGYQVNWNIFDRFQTLGNRSSAKARERIAEYSLEQRKLDVQLEVRQLYNTQLEARERFTLARETIANADEELRLAQERFKVGAGTMLEQITAQVNLSQAKTDEISASSDFLIASMHIDRAIGRSLQEKF